MQDNDLYDAYGRILTLDELTELLSTISAGEHQWSVRLHSVKCGARRRSYADIDFSNAEFVDMPNALRFRFPVIECGFWVAAEALICLHPSLAQPMVNGLYWEGDALKHDSLEDFQRFWDPIRERL